MSRNMLGSSEKYHFSNLFIIFSIFCQQFLFCINLFLCHNFALFFCVLYGYINMGRNHSNTCGK